MMKTNETDIDYLAIAQKFEEGLLDTQWSDNGQPTYIVKDNIDLEAYALIAKTVLEHRAEIAHDFLGTVTYADRKMNVTFEYKSGWFLDGLATGEIE